MELTTSSFTNKDDSFRDMPENYDFQNNINSFELFCGAQIATESPVRKSSAFLNPFQDSINAIIPLLQPLQIQFDSSVSLTYKGLKQLSKLRDRKSLPPLSIKLPVAEENSFAKEQNREQYAENYKPPYALPKFNSINLVEI